ncbi:DNA mismatch repair protein Mlh3 [Amphibalanus amphitrite]|uniref:DNA mismatch repair protein Mlh3 n=1 Tax=Amphibalanus amphitrite TaxID=1232801 RepID=A0A6A4WKI2_AMPAM|nr:DNA mismatch repair protein Mlh3 [Amphibalanus amphitrite]
MSASGSRELAGPRQPVVALPDTVQEEIRSGANITSAAQCVKELVRNALDAGASCVAVRVNLPQLEVQVVDNGTGMTPELMARVGDRYVTTHGDTPGRSSTKPFGYRGESLASIARVCRRLEITSRRRGSEQTWRRRLVTSSRSRRGGPVSSGGEGRSSPGDSGRGEAAGRRGTGAAPSPVSQQRPSAGTTVTVRGLLAGRRACRRQAELESVCRVLETLALPRPDVSFSLRDDATGRLLMDAARRSSVLERYSDVIEPLPERQARPLAARRGKVRVSGFTTASGGPQFVFVNGRSVGRGRVHRLAARLLAGAQSEAGRPGFLLLLRCPADRYSVVYDPDEDRVEFAHWQPVLTAVERAVVGGVADGAARLQGDGAEPGNEPAGTAAVPALSDDPESPPVSAAGEIQPAPSPSQRPTDQSDCEEILPGQVLDSAGADASHLPWADETNRSDTDRQDDGAQGPSGEEAPPAGGAERPNMPQVLVLKQLENKFIAACSGDVVLLFDQHAVSERINLENILEDAGATGGSERLRSTDLSPPLPLRLPRRQARLLAAHPAAVQRLGFVLEQLTELNDSEVAGPSRHEAALLSLRAAPACLCERAEREWTAQRAAAVLAQLADQLTESRGAAAALPAALADVYHSLACHSAVRFGDPLPLSVCERLVTQLSGCRRPLVCAHGRPSVVPLVVCSRLPAGPQEPRPRLERLRRLLKNQCKTAN